MEQHLPSSRIVLPPGGWASVLDFLCERFPAVGREVWIERMARGAVAGDGAEVHRLAPYRPGTVVTYRREVADEPRIPFEETIVHIDDDLVVVHKPHFLPVMPVGRYVEETLSVRLIRRLGNPDLVALHRLDRATAGLVVFSARPSSRDAYTRLFRDRAIVKTYEAVAAPMPDDAPGNGNAPGNDNAPADGIGRARREFPFVYESRLERGEPFFRVHEVPGKPNARTRIDVIERGERHWLYRLEPVTGRKHQLRVHMAALGAPIVGDPLYPVLREEAEGFSEPLRLLARELRFIDPLSGVERVFRSGGHLDL
jgi:tRNA pseudouridine32 synthase/23S rRNA pseudouridine746 synthase